MRGCPGTFRSSPTVNLHEEANILPLEYRRGAISVKFFYRMQTCPDPLTHQVNIVETQGDPSPNLEHIQSLLTQH